MLLFHLAPFILSGFFLFLFQHLTLTILGLLWLKMHNPFFHLPKQLEWLLKLPLFALCFATELHSSLKPEPPDPSAGPGLPAPCCPLHTDHMHVLLIFPLVSCCFWTICTTCHTQRGPGDWWRLSCGPNPTLLSSSLLLKHTHRKSTQRHLSSLTKSL